MNASPGAAPGAWKGAPPFKGACQLGSFGSIRGGSEARSTTPR